MTAKRLRNDCETTVKRPRNNLEMNLIFRVFFNFVSRILVIDLKIEHERFSYFFLG